AEYAGHPSVPPDHTCRAASKEVIRTPLPDHPRISPMTHTATRRRFLRSSAALAAATTLPNWFLDRCRAEPEPERPKSKNDTPGIALVGCGRMGRGDLKNAARFGRVVALCDVDEGHVAAAGKDWPDAARER